ncbi:pseudouridine synthase [Hygrophoropsis aurantiaca]|uniref:Pseudouridine synthase n=1 Tax=Hygrophoropsis aurantiaca TaxID=72124 RepID=A0ACB8AKD7_9AGAM|nr:pseudouridine synthase [Hygrophoropsis aurantiaca]
MPKVSLPQLPLSGLFAVAKPSGPTSMSVINDIKHLVGNSRLFVDGEKLEERKSKGKAFKRGKRARDTVKIGQGGTLDPLADGVLVVGVGKGTKRLNEFLDCVKEYRTTALLGCETDSYDGEGVRVRIAPWSHVTKESVESMLDKFRGEIHQTPPIFSALKMDGRPLYEYARQGIPLPRPIEPRKVTVHSLELVDWKGDDHTFRWPEKAFSDDEKKSMEKALENVEEKPVVRDEPELHASDVSPSAFVLSMKVSGGTYVRSIVHDLGHALGSAAHVVTLTRSRQGRFTLDPKEEGDKGCVPWEVFSKATESEGGVDEDGWTEWEREVIDRLEIVDGSKSNTAV